MPVNSPIPLTRQLEVLALAGLPASPHVVDVGCGTGELLLAMARGRASGLGLDVDGPSLDIARKASGDRRIEWRHGDASAVVLPAADLVCCVGSTHAYGEGRAALTGALAAFRPAVRPGGAVLIGEGFHQQPLPDPYAALLGSPSGLERTHLENVSAIEAAGFRCVHAIVASPAEWDAFEWGHFRRQLARVATLPAAEREAALERATRWRDAYLRWGRETMGFGLYLGVG